MHHIRRHTPTHAQTKPHAEAHNNVVKFRHTDNWLGLGTNNTELGLVIRMWFGLSTFLTLQDILTLFKDDG